MRLFTVLLYLLVLLTVILVIFDFGLHIAYQVDMQGYNVSVNLSRQLNVSVNISQYNFLLSITPYLRILDVATAIAIIFSIFALFLYFKQR